VQITSTIAIRKNLIFSVLHRLSSALKAGLTGEQAEHLQSMQGASQEEMQELSKLMQTDDGAKNGVGKFTDSKDDQNLRHARWAIIYPYYKSLGQAVDGIISYWKGWNSGTMRYSFKSLCDCMNRLAILTGFQLWTHVPEQLLFQHGYLREKFVEITKEMQIEFGSLFHRLKEFLEKRKREEEARRLQELMTVHAAKQQHEGEDGAASPDATVERMRRLGIRGEDAASLLQGRHKDPLTYVESLERDQKSYDVLNLRALEAVSKHVIGFHTLDLISGKNRLSVLFQGVDIFELIPPLEAGSMQQVAQESVLRKDRPGSKK
jgi:hypothetical protein